MNDTVVEEQLYLLAKLPSSTILTFQGYEINADIFYTVAQDKKSTNQNSGVHFDAVTGKGRTDIYYGYIEEIWELDYGPNFKVPLFRCKWVKMTGGGVKLDEQYGMTTVDLNNPGYLDEPFILAKDVARVLYVKDMSSKPRKRTKANTSCDEPKRHIVLSGVAVVEPWRVSTRGLRLRVAQAGATVGHDALESPATPPQPMAGLVEVRTRWAVLLMLGKRTLTPVDEEGVPSRAVVRMPLGIPPLLWCELKVVVVRDGHLARHT
jgi:hypothetical protein